MRSQAEPGTEANCWPINVVFPFAMVPGLCYHEVCKEAPAAITLLTQRNSAMNRFVSGLFVLLLASAGASAQVTEPIRFARTPDISPDGKLVAFSYLGDIWIVEAIGGVGPAADHARGARHQPGLQPRRQADRLLLQPPRQLRRLRRSRPGRQADAADLRLRRRHRHRLVARRQARPVRLEPQHRLPVALRAVHGRRSTGGTAAARQRRRRPRRRLFAQGRPDRLRPRAGHLVSQGLSRLVQRRHLDLQRRRQRTTAS